MRATGGAITECDLAAAQVESGPAVHSTYCGTDVHACGPWSQGPVVPMALNILECVDISTLDPDHPRLMHLCAEAIKLTFADREAYFGDPGFVDVPLDGLLHKGYGQIRYHERSPIAPINPCRRRVTPGRSQDDSTVPYQRHRP